MHNHRKDNQETQTTGAAEAAAPRVLGCPLPKWARRMGLAVFLFFLIKGLLWLIIPAGLIVWGWLATE